MTLKELARDALTHCQGEGKAAKYRLKRQLRSNKRLLDSVLDEVIALAVDEQVNLSHRLSNAHGLRTARGRMERTHEVAEVVKDVLLNLTLRSGKKLRDATRLDLKGEVTFFYHQGRTMITKGRFYKAAMERLLNDETTVGMVFTEEDLQSILDQSERPLSVSARAEVA